MSKPDRQDGFYWVRDKLRGKWRVAEWREGSYWLVAGLPHAFSDDNVGAEIDERRIERQEAMPVFRTGGEE